jgi:hypothetical protein
MARLIERTFDPSQPVVAAKSFIAGGRQFKIGQVLDWRKMGVSERRIRNMFGTRLIDHKSVVASTKAKKKDD